MPLAILFGFILLFQSSPDLVNRSLIMLSGQNFEVYSFTGKVNKGVRKVIEDRDGLFWIGTGNGVFSFDGYEATAYQERITDTLEIYFKGQDISGLLEDQNRNIWATTYEGSINVLPFGKSRFQNLDSQFGDLGFIPLSIAKDNDGYVWVNSINAILRIKYHPEADSIEFDYHKFEGFLGGYNGKHLYQLRNNPDGTINLLGDGLYEITYENGFNLTKKIEGEYFRDIIPYDEHRYLIGEKGKVLLYDERDGSSRDFWDNNTERYINRLYQGKTGNLWLSKRLGIHSLDNSLGDTLVTETFFQMSNVHDFYEDTSGNLFIASNVGLVKLNWNYQQYEYFEFPSDHQNRTARDFLIDHDGDYWVGVVNGLFRYEKDSEEFELIVNENINTIVDDTNGNILVLTNNGITIYDHEIDKPVKDLEIGNTWAVSKDSDNNFWLITDGTLMKLESEDYNIESYSAIINPIGESRIERLVVDSDDNLWVVDVLNKIHKYDVSTGKPIYIETFFNNGIRSGVRLLLDDGFGNLWICNETGVIVFNKQSQQSSFFNVENGLLGNDVNNMVQDQNGIIWLNQVGIGSIAIDPRIMEIVSYTPTWLTNSRQRNNIYSINSIGRDGSLITEGRGGFYVFHPDSISKNPVAPRVLLKDKLVNGIPFNNQVLKHTQDNIELRYTGVHMDEPDRNEFQFFLDGADETWVMANSGRSATYLNLKPGKYRFFVKAANSDGVWSDAIELASFSISPPWWGNPVAYSIYLLIIGLIGYRFYQIQLNKTIAESEAERLKEVDEFKSRFFTNISHEFRTPLTVIMGLADRIKHESTPVIKRNASKLLELINQILELSKLEANQSGLKNEKFDFIDYTTYTVESLSTLASERGIELKTKSEMDELFVELDKQKVDLIFHNLLSNALKFTDKSGEVTVVINKRPNSIVFSVADTGIGIKEEDLDQIFNRFFQSDLDNHRFEGTGIGLALTNELVNLMNGNIQVESEPGTGSTFTVELPCVFIEPEFAIDQKTDEEIKSVETSTSSNDAEVILLVEDNYDVRNFIKQILSDEYQIVVAHNGKEGVEQALERIPDVILTDVMMPYKDGLELTEELKKDVRTSHIPIIMLTAKADVESRVSGLKTGADVYLGKPFNEEELKTHIHNLINLRNSIRKQYGGDIQVNELGNSLNDEFVKKIHDSILENLDDELFGIEQVCRAVGVSRTQLHRKLKAITGKSSSIFIRDIRLIEARKMLKNTELTVSEIAFSVGFSDPKYFSKLYSEKFFNPPSKEREIVD